MKVNGFFVSEGVTLKDDVLHNVVVLGPRSKNGREYSDNAMRSAVPLYEGMSVYADHDPKAKGRKVEERFGHLTNVRWVPQERRVRADLHFLASHPIAPRVREAVEKSLPYFGLSHVADARGRKDRDKTFVEEVTKVMSVDLVDNAATGTLVEQDGGDMAMEGGDPFVAAATALLADASLDKDTLLAKLGELYDTLRGDGSAEAGGEAPAETPPATEQAQPETLNDKITKLVEQEIAKALKKAAPKKYLKPAVTVTEQATPTNAVPNDRKALSAWLKKD